MKYMKLGTKPDIFQREANNIRFVATDLVTDIVVRVGDMKFYLHKFPLLSKSYRLQKLVAATHEDSTDEINISDIPGGSSAFEICAKFCYGMVVTLNAYNVVSARCASEYLEMYETVEKGNLIYKIEVFLSSSIFRTWKDSIIVLKSAKSLLPWSNDLKIISHSIDCIASKASIDPSEIEWSYTYNRNKLPSENGLDSHWNGVLKQQTVPKDWWVEDICELEMDFYKRVILAVKTEGRISSEVIGESLRAYADRRLPRLLDGRMTTASSSDFGKFRTVLENIVMLLPTERGPVSCSFLLKLLKAACFLDCGVLCQKDLIRRISQRLDDASLADLLIPSAIGEATMYNVDIIMLVIEEFLAQCNNDVLMKILVAKLMDGYLAEIARDPNLPISKFVKLAEMLPDDSRPVHDGLYHAIDMYLNEHPDLGKSEKKKICRLMDCRKLSSSSSMHAVQNERLPLRVIVQILFFEQVRASAVASTGVSSSDRINLHSSTRSLLHRKSINSYGSSQSAATTTTNADTEELLPAGDLNSCKSARLTNKSGDSRSCSSSGGELNRNEDESNASNIKGIPLPRKIMRSIWSGKGSRVEISESDTSESPAASFNPEDTKSTPSKSKRHSVS